MASLHRRIANAGDVSDLWWLWSVLLCSCRLEVRISLTQWRIQVYSSAEMARASSRPQWHALQRLLWNVHLKTNSTIVSSSAKYWNHPWKQERSALQICGPRSHNELCSPRIRSWLESGRLSNQIYRLSSRELRSLSDHLDKLQEPTRPHSRSRRLKDPELLARTHARREQVTSHSYRVSLRFVNLLFFFYLGIR